MTNRMRPRAHFVILAAVIVALPPPPAACLQTPQVILADGGFQLDDSKGVSVPFEYDPLDRPLMTVQASINGSKAYTFIVDTGTSDTLFIGRWVQEELKAPLTRKTVKLNPGNLVAQITAPLTVTLLGPQGGRALDLSDVTAEVVDLPGIDTYFRPRPAGIIGARLFVELTSRFDFDKHTITFFKFKHPPVSPAGPYASLSLLQSPVGQTFRVTLSLPGAGPRTFSIDTGDTISYVLASDAANLTGLAVRRGGSHSDISGAYPASTWLLRELEVGAVKPSLSFSFFSLMVVSNARSNSLCMDLFACYRVTIDPNNRIVTFEPRDGFTYRRPGDCGLDMDVTGGHATVTAVTSRAAAVAGITVNDHIVSIDGVNANEIALTQARNHLNGYEGITATVVVEKPGGKRLTVKLYRRSVFPNVVKGVSGITLLTVTKLPAVVLEVSPGSAAAQAGVQAGDQVITINGQTVSKRTVDWLYSVLAKSDVSITIKVRRKNETVTIMVPGSKP